MSNSLYDQKSFLTSLLEVIKTNGWDDDPKFSNMYDLETSSTILVVKTWFGLFKSLITTWWGENFIF